MRRGYGGTLQYYPVGYELRAIELFYIQSIGLTQGRSVRLIGRLCCIVPLMRFAVVKSEIGCCTYIMVRIHVYSCTDVEIVMYTDEDFGGTAHTIAHNTAELTNQIQPYLSFKVRLTE